MRKAKSILTMDHDATKRAALLVATLGAFITPYGILIYTIASFSLILCHSSVMLIVLRGLQGIGSSMIFTNGVAILISVFPASERGKVIGFNVAAVYLGLSIGPILGGFLTQHFGWRSIFLINVLIGVIILVSI